MNGKQIFELTKLKRGMSLETMEELKKELSEIFAGKHDFHYGLAQEKFDNGKGIKMNLEIYVSSAIDKLSRRISNKKWGK